ncbi:MAG: UDP-N-acetylmuramate dehydrogenase [Bacilli bacterium]
MKKIIEQLRNADIGVVLVDEPLSNHTTWRIGGPADLMLIPKSKEALIQCMKIVYEHRVPWTVIGRGSNLLVRDGGIRGVVFKIGVGLDHIHFDGHEVYAEAGFSFIKLAVLAGKEGLSGLEFAGGIPGSVGGALFMNAGAHGSEVARILKFVEVLHEVGTLVTLTPEEMKFSYRKSILQGQKSIVTSARFQLERGDRKAISEALAIHKDRRRQTQPLQLPCAGSVFRNPLPQYAGQLIESLGLKGHRIGGAEISNLHANFIVNVNNAKAKDVLNLIEMVREKVKNEYNIQIIPEVEVIGEEREELLK